ncbi:MAG: PKD-like domain-containing protein, partial [Saprospiraceae bacterium]|nr:PKD-like domain-containing protein [Saprospiraceae bacterium]
MVRMMLFYAAMVFSLLLFSPQKFLAQCPQIEAIMIDACGTEQLNEFVIIHSGGGFNTANIELDFDPNNNFAGPQNNDININANPCGLMAGNINAYSGCPNLIAVGPGVNIPPNAIVVLQTSAGSQPNTYNFSNLCGGGQCVFVISSTCVRTGGAFTNGGGNGLRTTNFSIAGGCNQSITYDLQQVPVGNGTYMLPLAGTFGNDGCVAPPVSAPFPRPNIDPIPNVTACGSYILPPITGTNLTPNAAYYTGTNGSGTRYDPGDTITTTTTLYAFDSNGPGCSDQEQFTVTIIPTPTVNPPANQTVCGNQAVTVNFTGSPGATFQWTNNNTNIGLGASGTGNISFTAANPANPEVATITVTPAQGSCQGTPVTFTITVNPRPVVNNPGNQTACAGQQVTVNFSSPSGNPTYSWTNNNTAIGLGASGTGNISFTAASPANPTTGTISVTATENGCTSTAQTFTITINPAATVNTPANQTVCAGQQVTVNFTGSPGATFAWTNNNTNIGLGASGTGNISFTAAGVSSQEVGTITVTPTSPAGCTGAPATFTITVNPGPTVNNPGDQAVCAGQSVTINFSSPSGNPTYNWTNNNPAIGLGNSGTGNINFTASNPANPVTGTISVTATLSGCTGPAQTFTITVNPAATMTAPPNQTACAGQQVTVNFSGSPGATFNWTNSNTNIGLPASGSGNLNFTAANVSSTQTATITVTPVSPAGCAGSAVVFLITVNPAPNVNPPSNQTVCGGQSVTVNFSGSPGASFQWTNSNTAIGLGASGTGNISFTAANPANQEVGTITVTPVQGACQGTPATFTITVNPAPTVNNPGNQTACAGQQVTVNFSSPAGNPTFNWTNNNTAIGLGASGTGNISFTAASPANPTTGTISVTATLNGCTGPAQTFTITINPAATVNPPANQTACAGQQVTVNFTGSAGATFAWTNSNTAIGLGASGTGNISFTAAGVSSPEVGTITVTPTSPAGCVGSPATFTITVNPGPTVNPPGDQTVCAGQQVTVNFSSPAGNPTFNWTNNNTGIGLGASGTGNISFTAASPANPTTGTISVAATLNGCTGTAQTFTITVNPAATVNPPANQTACAGQQVTVNFTGSAGATFAWTNSNTAIGLGASGTGNISFTAAGVSSPEVGTITVTPTSPAGCVGSPATFTITVNPGPTVNPPGNQTVCAGQQVTVNFSSPSGNPTYNWTNNNTAIGLGASGTGNISFTAASPANPTTGTISVTATLNGCTGTAQTFTITVNPAPTVNNPGNQTACAGQQVTVNFSSPAGSPTFNWTNSNTAIGLGASGTGNISFTAASPANPTTGTISVTATENGCTGPAQTFTITVNPAATVNPPASQTACAGQQVTVNFTGSTGATFAWTNSNTAIGLGASGTGNISFTAAGVSSPEVGTITVTPTSPAGCVGSPATFTITVNPNPTMNAPANQAACGGDAVSVTFSSPSGNPTYNWTNNNPAIGLPASGTGNISFTAANPASPQTATITVTPTLNGCTGTAQTFTIAITPRPTVNPVANQTACGGQTVTINFSGTAGATFAWTNDNPAIGLPASGTGNLNFVATNSPNPQTATITVTPQLGNCTGNPISFTLTINPTPAIDPVSNVFACAGNFISVVFSSPSGNPTYTWTNSNPAIGLGAAGVGNIGFNAANTGSTQTGLITVTPQLGGCAGAPTTFTISVSPAPTMGQPANASACGGSTVSVAFAGTPGAVFEWTNNNPNIGLAPAGSGNISFVSANPDNVEVATITVTPVLNGCAGLSRTFTITIRPTPQVNFPGDRAVCGGDPVSVVFSSPSGNPTYAWANNNPAIGLGAAGVGNINFTSAVVTTPQIANILVTPSQAGCTGPTVSFTIIVSPAPTANPVKNVVACAGQVQSIALSGSPGASFNWTNNNTATGLAASGSGSTIVFTPANVGAPQVSVITVTPVIGTCSGPPVTFEVEVRPTPTMNPVSNRTVCAGESVAIVFSGTPNASFNWTNSNPAIGLPAQGAGNLSFVAAGVSAPQTAQIAVVPELGGCVGLAQSFSITVTPGATLPPLSDTTVCAGDTVLRTLVVPGASVAWTNSNPGIGLPASGQGSLQFVTAPVSSLTQALISVTATPDTGGCPSVSKTFALRVKPTLRVDKPSDRTVCANELLQVLFSNPNVRWKNDNPAIGLPASGVGNLNFTAANVSGVETANITVEPIPPAGYAYVPNIVGYVSVIDLATNTVVTNIPVSSEAYGVAVSPDGRRVYVSTGGNVIPNGSLTAIDVATNTVIGSTPLTHPRGVAVSTNSSEVYVSTIGALPRYFIVLDAQTLAIKNNLTPPFMNYEGIVVSPDGATAYVGASSNVLGINLTNYAQAAIPAPTNAQMRGVDMDPSGRFLFAAYDSKFSALDSLWMLDLQTGSTVAFATVGSAPNGVAFNPANGLVYVANENSDNVSVVNPATGTVVATIPAGIGPMGVSVTPDGQRVYAACLSGEVYVINAANNTVSTVINVGGSATAFGRFITPAQVCTGPQTFRITVTPPPAVAPVSNVTACSKQQISVAFTTSPGASVQWTNNNPAIGLPASGTGNLSFTSASVSTPQTATITATPVVGNCTGTPISFSITVVPGGADTFLINKTTCNPSLAGTTVQTLTNRFGCDSVVITTTQLLPSDTVNLSRTTCNPAAVGVFTQRLTNRFGCDSTVITTVTFDPAGADTTLLSRTTCNPNLAGTTVQTLTNQSG